LKSYSYLEKFNKFNQKDITSIAIGSFDGMHFAHQQLFKRLDSNNINNSLIIVIENGKANLTPYNFRDRFTKYPIFYIKLEKIKDFTAIEFINFLKEKFINLQKIVIGYDFKFGKNRKYGIKDIKENSNFQVDIIDEVKLDNNSIHSTLIRDFIKNGDMQNTKKFLNRFYIISGKVIKGQGLGSKEFVPTINISIKDFLLPKAGVYLTYTTIKNKIYESITFLGHRLTTDGNFAIETHILNQKINPILENIDIEIKFIELLRENIKFTDFKSLKIQINKDCKNAEKNFSLKKKKVLYDKLHNQKF
jgi:riboflavin kinase/FMN adenylyltransferase